MTPIPNTPDGYALMLRTNFSDEPAWEAICAAIQEPVGDFRACVEFLSAPQYEALSVPELLLHLPEDTTHTFLFVADKLALSHPDRPILVVDLLDEPGRTFRVIPSAMQSVENNLSIANMGFEEFADNADQDGIFRGF